MVCANNILNGKAEILLIMPLKLDQLTLKTPCPMRSSVRQALL